jgi:hypothetical protein
MLPLPFDKDRAKELLTDQNDTTATTLHFIILATFGQEVYGDLDEGIEPMDPVELWARIEDEYGIDIPESAENKIQALMMGLESDLFYEEPEALVAVASALYTGDLGDLVEGVMETPTLTEMFWAAFELGLNRDSEPEFSPKCMKFLLNQVMTQAMDPEDGDVDEDITDRKEQILAEMAYLKVSDEVLSDISNRMQKEYEQG